MMALMPRVPFVGPKGTFPDAEWTPLEAMRPASPAELNNIIRWLLKTNADKMVVQQKPDGFWTRWLLRLTGYELVKRAK